MGLRRVLSHYSRVYSQSDCLNGKVSSEFCGHSTSGDPKHKWLNRFWEKNNNMKLEMWQTMMSSGCDAVPLKRTLQQEWHCIILQVTQQIQQTPQSNQSRPPIPQKEKYPNHINYHYVKQGNLIKCNDRTLTLLPEASLPFPSSATWKRRFSSRMTDPVAGLAQAFSTSGPTQSFRKVTSLQRQRGCMRSRSTGVHRSI